VLYNVNKWLWQSIYPWLLICYPNLQVNLGLKFILVLILVQIESDDDILWKTDIREKNEEVAARGMKFLKWWLPILHFFSLFPRNLILCKKLNNQQRIEILYGQHKNSSPQIWKLRGTCFILGIWRFTLL